MTAPNPETGIALGHLIAAGDFGVFPRIRDFIPKARFTSETPDELAAELDRTVAGRRADLDALMDE